MLEIEEQLQKVIKTVDHTDATAEMTIRYISKVNNSDVIVVKIVVEKNEK